MHNYKMKKMTAILLGSALLVSAPIAGQIVDSDSGLMAQISQKEKDFSDGIKRYLYGINNLPKGDAIQENTPDLGNLSYSSTNFKRAKNLFFAVVMADPNYNDGRALEMYVMSKLALNEDVTGTVKEYLGRSDFKYKTKLKNFLVDILNEERGEINFLWDQHPKIQQAASWGKNVEDFDHFRTIELLQTLYEVDKNAFNRVSTDEEDITSVAQLLRREGKGKKALNILNENWNKYPKSASFAEIKGNTLKKIGEIKEAKKYWNIAKERTNKSDQKEYFQWLIDNN